LTNTLGNGFLLTPTANLGHSEISMTMDTYSHALPTMQKDAMDGLNDFFDSE